MKKIYVMIAVLIVAISVVLGMNVSNVSNDLAEANVEALASSEGAIIICDSGNCGYCFEEETAWPFYKCNWTGMQKDYCDCSKVGYL